MIENFDAKYSYENIFKSIGLDNTIKNFIVFLDFACDNFFENVIVNDYNVLFQPFGIYSSIDTLKSLYEICINGDFIAAKFLLRKIRDNLFFDLFVLCDIQFNVPPNLDTNNKGKEQSDYSEPIRDLALYAREYMDFAKENQIKSALNRWGKSELSYYDKKKFFDFGEYKKKIKDLCPKAKNYLENYANEFLKELGIKLNDFAHNNGLINMINPNKYSFDKFFSGYNEINNLLKMLLKIFVILLFLICPLALVSTDYYDRERFAFFENERLDQLYLIYNIKYIFDEIKNNEKPLYDFLKQNNDYNLHIE